MRSGYAAIGKNQRLTSHAVPVISAARLQRGFAKAACDGHA
jgi:hypothetical protein